MQILHSLEITSPKNILAIRTKNGVDFKCTQVIERVYHI